MQTYCGYIALLGRPNAGKSTLLNACIGQKIVGVSKRPQTTRNRVLGVDHVAEHELIFLDTPGMHKSAGQPKMNQLMNKTAWATVAEANVICYLVDAKAGWHSEDSDYLSSLLQKANCPIFVVATKVESAKKAEIDTNLAGIKEGIKAVYGEARPAHLISGKPYPLSAKRGEMVSAFKAKLMRLLPAGPWLFDADDITDKSERFVVAEMIREQVFRHVGQELPYGTTVVIDSLTSLGKTTTVKATIITNRASHKPIIIGKGGSLIKKIGSEARATLETHFGQKVFLELFVKVSEKWTHDASLISEFQQIEDIS